MITTQGQITKLENVIAPEDLNTPSTVPAFIVQREEALKKFRKSIAKDDSLRTHEERFLHVMAFLESGKTTGSYTFRDAVIYSRGFDGFSVEILRELFDKYVETMISLRRLSIVNGCYSDEPVYVIQ